MSLDELIGLLPHEPPMRLIDHVLECRPGVLAVTTRVTRKGDWFFQGHFPGAPVVPAIILVELLAQTGGLAAGASVDRAAAPLSLRVAAIGPFKFPAPVGPGATLTATARITGSFSGLIRIDGYVTVDAVVVAEGSITLANRPSDPKRH